MVEWRKTCPPNISHIRGHTRPFTERGRRLATWVLSQPRPEDQNESYITPLLTWQRTQWASVRRTYQWTTCREIIAVYWDSDREYINVLCVLSFKTGSRDNKSNYGTCFRLHPARREVRYLIFYLLVATYKIGVEKTYQWLISLCISGVPRGGLGCSTPPKFRRPSNIVPNSTRLWKLLKTAEFRKPTHQDVRKKGSKILKLPRFAIVLH